MPNDHYSLANLVQYLDRVRRTRGLTLARWRAILTNPAAPGYLTDAQVINHLRRMVASVYDDPAEPPSDNGA